MRKEKRKFALVIQYSVGRLAESKQAVLIFFVPQREVDSEEDISFQVHTFFL